ncbi:hypothetical protein K431DRAFT_296263 [Polychaeton citri CBS 116435]|uniref:Uncharacterized protein n=1 Tax=Polychaeton citri CBS 116435 TaxID=1314669 RepID=A0A9P4Q6C1_9PEZI|nr:hypothetical protein K431DRAFT_296263 [Polychaeton citri CBS 116435]
MHHYAAALGVSKGGPSAGNPSHLQRMMCVIDGVGTGRWGCEVWVGRWTCLGLWSRQCKPEAPATGASAWGTADDDDDDDDIMTMAVEWLLPLQVPWARARAQAPWEVSPQQETVSRGEGTGGGGEGGTPMRDHFDEAAGAATAAAVAAWQTIAISLQLFPPPPAERKT